MSTAQIRIETNADGTPVFVYQSPSSKQPVKVPLKDTHRQGVGTKNDLLFRALGRKKTSELTVLDLTAGLLRDSLHMVRLGFRVIAIEREVQLAEALNDWLKTHPNPMLTLVHADAFKYLEAMEESAYAIYMDPMYPDVGRTALSGKESQLLQHLVGRGDEAESSRLLKLATEKTEGRVVVKRPRKAALLLPKPKSQVIGKSTRYDIY